MKKFVSFMLMALLPMLAGIAANAQELTVSDIEYIDEVYNEGYNEEYPMIILTMESSVLNVHLVHYSAHPNTEEFVIIPMMSGGSDGDLCSVSIGVSYINNLETSVITTFDVSFNIHGIEDSSFYLSCWWFKGQVTLTEGEPLELWENKNISKDRVTYTLNNKTKTATLSSGRHVEGECKIPSELDYGGQTFLLTNIDYPAFAFNTSLTSVIIPKSVTNIGNAVFYLCYRLTDVYCYAENVPETGINVFKDCPIASATLHVPAGSIEEYKTTSPWSNFGNIVALQEEPHQPQSFLEGNPIWVYKYEHIPRGLIWRDGHWVPDCWVDISDRHFTYYFLGNQKEIDGKVYTMMGAVISKGEDDFTVNHWLPVREENGVVYAITDSLPGIAEYYYYEDYPVPYLQQGNECVLYNFSTDIGETLYPQQEGSTVKSYDTYQFLDGTEGCVLKTNWSRFDLYEKMGLLNDNGMTFGVMDPLSGMIIPTNGHVYVSCLNAFYQDNTMLYKAPDAQEGLCVNDTIWTRDDAEAYASSYKANPYHEEVMSYIRRLQKANEPVAYFPEGTKWTEIRLDTLKYNSWYSKVGEDWVPNFETIEYRVQGEYTGIGEVYKKVYSNGPEWTDSLAFLLLESRQNVETTVMVDNYLLCPGVAYQFDWSVGKGIYYRDIIESNKTGGFPYYFFFGVINEIKEGDFGGVRPLKYVDLDGKAPDNTYEYWDWGFTDARGGRIIQGIGITEWNDGECLFGPPNPYYALYGWTSGYKDRHYRSMLVHFERNNEVLYDVWPEKPVASEPVTFTAGQMATIILPTTPDASKGKYYRLDRYEDGQIIFEQELQPQAHIPYIIVPNEDFSINLSALDLAGCYRDTVSVDGISFIGSYVSETFDYPDGFYIDFIDITPDCRFDESCVIGALRAYLLVRWDDPYNQGGTRVPPLNKRGIVLRDYETGITSPLWETGEATLYDLQGRMLPSKPAQGIYIKNRQKVMVK